MAPSSPDHLLPHRAVYAAGEHVVVDAPAGVLEVTRLGHPVRSIQVDAAGAVDLGTLPAGGYALTLRGSSRASTSAVDVHDDTRSVLRYGFVASYRPDADPDAVSRLARRLHLTGVQFYDWAYRHADLLGGGETYDDPLGQPISLATVRAQIAALHGVGADALGYAAVYGVGADEWPRWSDLALVGPGGEAESLGDFLWLVDPAAPRWLEHFCADLAAASGLGFDGFHLDQYGYPRLAQRTSGEPVDVAESFATMLDAVRAALPTSRLCFNNVNDFPTWRTASAPQDVTYIEPWPPHTTYSTLARLVTRARLLAPKRPVVVAAYQGVYAHAERPAADQATRLTMATLHSHGATQLLAGEGGRVLVDPYYVRNHEAEPETLDMLQAWLDFAVAQGELLFPATVADVTGTWWGPYNGVLDLAYEGFECDVEAAPGRLWVRVTQPVPGRLVVHVINLAGQADAEWDAPKAAPDAMPAGRLRVRRAGAAAPRVFAGDPDRSPALVPLAGSPDGPDAVYEVPAPGTWQLLLIEFGEDA